MGLLDTFVNNLRRVVSGEFKSSVRPSDYNLWDFYNRTGNDFESTVLSCTYRGTDCSDFSQNWKTVFTRYGKCLTFNNPDQRERIKQTLKGGVDNGMELILDLQQHEFMPVWSNNDELSIEAGFKVQIHSQDEPPFIHELG